MLSVKLLFLILKFRWYQLFLKEQQLRRLIPQLKKMYGLSMRELHYLQLVYGYASSQADESGSEMSRLSQQIEIAQERILELQARKRKLREWMGYVPRKCVGTEPFPIAA